MESYTKNCLDLNNALKSQYPWWNLIMFEGYVISSNESVTLHDISFNFTSKHRPQCFPTQEL